LEEYYDRRAREYDDWYLGRALFAGRERPGWDVEVRSLVATLKGLRRRVPSTSPAVPAT
jgi:hypothetical protein